MIINDTLEINGSLAMSGGANHYFGLTPKTTADRNILIGGWGPLQKGRSWFNSDLKQWEGWDGTAVVIIG